MKKLPNGRLKLLEVKYFYEDEMGLLIRDQAASISPL
jgi:hypothetical protein